MTTKRKVKKVKRKAAKKVVKRKVNLTFPGRPGYRGPNEGRFAFVHHGVLYEHSHDIQRRIDSVQRDKPEDEKAIRLRSIMLIGKGMSDRIGRGNITHREILAYITRKQPDHTWKGRTLHKADGTEMTG